MTDIILPTYEMGSVEAFPEMEKPLFQPLLYF